MPVADSVIVNLTLLHRALFIARLTLLLKKLTLVLCCGAFISALDGGCFVLQVGAWVKMAYAYSHQDDLKSALVKTFDGEHPCEICKHVARRGGEHQQIKALALEGKIKAAPVSHPIASQLIAPVMVPRPPGDLSYLDSVYLSPRTPPPRV